MKTLKQPNSGRAKNALRPFLIIQTLFLSGLLALTAPLSASADPRAEQVMAALFFNFAKFVDWSAEGDKAVTFGVVGAPEFAEELSKITKARGVGGRNALVKTFANAEQLSPVDAVFV